MTSIQENIKNCPICNTILSQPVDKINERGIVYLTCLKCGPLKIGLGLIHPESFYQKYSDKGLKVAAILRRKYEETNETPIFISSKDLLILEESKTFPRYPYDKALLLMQTLCSISKEVNAVIDLRNEEYIEIIKALSVLENNDELIYFLKYLDGEGFVEYRYTEIEGPDIPINVSITMKGWSKYYELQQNNKESRQAFIAMSFSEEMDQIYEKALCPAVKSAGYDPYRIDKTEHNEKICDLIIYEVKRSRFLIADITNHKKGVYFEAGYALGLGIPVIWCCKNNEDELKNMHFDTRQYNHILWNDIDDLKDRLEKRIKATIS